MTSRDKYEPYPKLVIRTPRYPLSVLVRCLSHRQQMLRTFGSRDFRNAVLLASPALYRELKWLLDNKSNSSPRHQKVQAGLLKYLTRMSMRCTPFATMSSAGCVSWGNRTDVTISGPYDEHYRLDMLYACIISQMCLRNREIRQHLSYRANDTIYYLGKQLRFIAHSAHGQGRTFSVKSLGMNPLLQAVLRKCRKPVRFTELTASLKESYELNDEQSAAFVHSLIDLQVLTSDIDPVVTGKDLTGVLAQRLPSPKTKEATLLRRVAKLLSSFGLDKSPAGNEALHSRLQSLLQNEGIEVNPKFLVQADMFSIHEQCSVSGKIAHRLRQGMEFMTRIVPMSRNMNIERFKQRFTARYQDQEIALLEALDPDVGVGYVQTDSRIGNPLIHGLRLPARQQSQHAMAETPLQRLLQAKLARHNWSESRCITLTDSDVTHLPATANDLPATMAAMFSVIDDGDNCVLADLRFYGPSAANLLGRFAYGDEGIHALVRQIARDEQRHFSTQIVAEIAHLPQSRTGNILSRPHLRDYEITYLTNSLMDSDHLIPVSDLLISVRSNRVVLRSAKLQAEILPRLTTAHNYSGTGPTPVYRFLCDMQHPHGRTALTFSWGRSLAHIEHLPRVMYRNIILSRERWLLRCDSLPFRKGKVSSEAIKNWSSTVGLPQYVMLVAGDNKLLVDTCSTASVEAMMSELGNVERFVLEEFLPCRAMIKDSSGRHYQNECIAPMRRAML